MDEQGNLFFAFFGYTQMDWNGMKREYNKLDSVAFLSF